MIHPGVSEYDIGLDIEFFFRRNGAGLAFEPIVASGVRGALPHARASEKKLERGDLVTMDFGAKLDGYCSDITRTVAVAQADDRAREIYQTVLQAQIESLEAMKPGVAATEVDAVARKLMGDYAQYFGHGLGHGLGKLVHDTGRLSPTSKNVLAVGQVWTVEPGIYIPEYGGCRIENDVVVTAGGVDVLDISSKELMIIG
jgi:Xaa-Pro aminopeptidase